MKRLLLVASLAALFMMSSCASVEPARVTAAAQRLHETFPQWEIREAEATPEVVVGQYRGYRIVLQLRTMYPAEPWSMYTQQFARPRPPIPEGAKKGPEPTMFARYEHLECVLFPEPVANPLALRNRIPWLELEQLYYDRLVYAGEGFGFTWFCNGAIGSQDLLRRELNLQGGEDRLQLAYECLKVQDEQGGTATSCVSILASAGDAGSAYIRKAAEECPEDLARGLYALVRMRGGRITDLLCELHRSANAKLPGAAEYVLAHKPFRPEAKSVYLDMLRNPVRVREACEACIEFDWKEAIPILKEVCAKPGRWWQYRTAFDARRSLEGNPVPWNLKEAEDVVRRAARPYADPADADKVPGAKAALLGSEDREAVTVIATGLAIDNNKLREELVHRAGLEVLQQLPKPLAYDFVRQMASAVQDRYEQRDLARLEQALAPQQ